MGHRPSKFNPHQPFGVQLPIKPTFGRLPGVRKGVLQRAVRSAIHQLKGVKRLLPVSDRQWAKLDLLTTLVQRDLEARYKGSILGNLWPLLNQLVQLLVYTYVFSIVLQVRPQIQGLPTNSLTFGFWLFAGLIPWMAFINGFAQAATSVVSQPNLVKKIVFPLELLPLVPVLAAFIESLSGLVVAIALLGFTTQTVHSTLWLFPLVWIPQLLLTSGLAYLAAGLTVFLRDIPQTIGVLLNLLFYLTPIIYPASAIPEQFRLWVFRLNPFATVVELYRDLLLVGDVQHWMEGGALWLVSLPVFLVGRWIYQRLRPAFADVL